MKEIGVVATLTLKKAEDQSVIEAIKALHQATHKDDKGCIQYDVHKDTEKENTYVFVERWESEARLIEHMEKEHFKRYKAFMADKIESMSLQKLEKIF